MLISLEMLYAAIQLNYYKILQVTLALLLGALIGFEREHRGSLSLAGIRTYAAMSVGACVFGLISIQSRQFGHDVGVDVSRIAAQVVSGVGFIGTGVIFRDGAKARGLTTAASLWASAAVGLAVAFKMFLLAFITSFYIYILLLLSHFKWWRKVSRKARNATGNDDL